MYLAFHLAAAGWLFMPMGATLRRICRLIREHCDRSWRPERRCAAPRQSIYKGGLTAA